MNVRTKHESMIRVRFDMIALATRTHLLNKCFNFCFEVSVHRRCKSWRAMAAESMNLAELNDKSSGIGKWVLKVYGMRHQSYEYELQGKAQKGEKLECLLLATDGNYCQGVIKTVPRKAGGADPGVELQGMMKKFFDGSTWAMSKVTLLKEKKRMHWGTLQGMC